MNIICMGGRQSARPSRGPGTGLLAATFSHRDRHERRLGKVLRWKRDDTSRAICDATNRGMSEILSRA